MSLANLNLNLVVLLTVWTAVTMGENVMVNWSLAGIQQYANSPLNVRLGDKLVFTCVPDSFTNAFYMSNETEFTNCDGGNGERVFRVGSCINEGNVNQSFFVTIKEHSDEITTLRFQVNSTFYFASFSEGNSIGDAIGVGHSGGECLNGLKLAIRVNPALPPTDPPTSSSTDPVDPGDEGGLVDPETRAIIIIAVAVPAGIILLLIVVLFVSIYCVMNKRCDKQKLNKVQENGSAPCKEKIPNPPTSNEKKSDGNLINGKQNGINRKQNGINGKQNGSRNAPADPPPSYTSVSSNNSRKNNTGGKLTSNGVSNSLEGKKKFTDSAANSSSAGTSIQKKHTDSAMDSLSAGRSKEKKSTTPVADSPSLSKSKTVSSSSSSKPVSSVSASSSSAGTSAQKKYSSSAADSAGKSKEKKPATPAASLSKPKAVSSSSSRPVSNVPASSLSAGRQTSVNTTGVNPATGHPRHASQSVSGQRKQAPSPPVSKQTSQQATKNGESKTGTPRPKSNTANDNRASANRHLPSLTGRGNNDQGGRVATSQIVKKDTVLFHNKK